MFSNATVLSHMANTNYFSCWQNVNAFKAQGQT